MSTSRTTPAWTYDINEPSAIMVHIDSGKSSPTGRVNQSAQKGETCMYYAMNYLRDRIGKMVPAGMEEKRKLEKILSAQRKELTRLTIVRSCEWFLVSTADCVIRQKQAKHKSIDDIHATLMITLQNFLAGSQFKIFFEHTAGYPFTAEHQGYMREFIRTYKSVYTFYLSQGYQQERLLDLMFFTDLKQSKAFISFYEKSFKEQQLDIDELYKMFRQDCEGIASLQPFPESLNSLSEVDINTVLHRIYHMTNLRLNHIKQSNWHPLNGIDGLIRLIRERGPVIASGHIGKHYYASSSVVELKVGAIHAKAFKPNSAKISKEMDSHVVLVVGVTKSGYSNSKFDLVYYVDPKVPQKANEPLVIYTVSYNTFIKRLIEVHGLRGSDDVTDWNGTPHARFFHYRESASDSEATASLAQDFAASLSL